MKLIWRSEKRKGYKWIDFGAPFWRFLLTVGIGALMILFLLGLLSIGVRSAEEQVSSYQTRVEEYYQGFYE